MSKIQVDCRPSGDGWSCEVAVDGGDGGRGTRHVVGVPSLDLARLDPGAPDPTDLVRRSFAFLLRRESKDSILSSFDLTVISRYFPEYESEIRRP